MRLYLIDHHIRRLPTIGTTVVVVSLLRAARVCFCADIRGVNVAIYKVGKHQAEGNGGRRL